MFLKKFAANCAGLMLIVFAMGAHAQTYVEVYPTGQYPDDVVNVQAAIDSFGHGVNGAVLLKAHSEKGVATPFNFGTDANPQLRGGVAPLWTRTGALEIRGEVRKDGHTVIEGGYLPISTHRHDAIVVQHIEFRGAYKSAISVREGTRVEILDNVILDTQGNEATTVLTRPIEVAASWTGSLSEIEGPVIIRRNSIIGASGYFVQGISIVSVDAMITVADNKVSGANVGIQLLYYQQPALLFGNTLSVVVPRANFFSAGIELSAGVGSDASVQVSRNRIAVSDINAEGWANGIIAGTSDSEIEGDLRNSLIFGNELQLKNADNAIGLFLDGQSREISDNIIARNTVLGTTDDGIYLERYSGATGRMLNNHIAANRLLGMHPSANSHIWLSEITRNTMCFVQAGSILVDNGTDNTVIVGAER